jgi:hypothetical protein
MNVNFPERTRTKLPTDLLGFGSKLHQELVTVEHLKGLANDLELLNAGVRNDVGVGRLERSEDWIAVRTSLVGRTSLRGCETCL